MKTLSTLGFLLLFFIEGFCKAFPGYVLTLEGDTLSGYLFFSNEIEIGHSIGFSPTKSNSPSTTYYPQTIQAFQFSGTRFISAKVPVEKPYVQESLDEPFIRPENQIKHIFLTVDVEGPASLYYFRETEKIHHFYARKNQGKFQELVKYEYYRLRASEDRKKNETVRYKITDNKYLSQLKDLFPTCSSTKPDISRTKWVRADLVKLFKRLNTCLDQDIQPIYVNPNGKEEALELFIQAGINFTNLSFSPIIDPWRTLYLTEQSFPAQTTPSFGGMVRFYPSHYKRNWFVSTGFLTKTFDVKGIYLEGTEANLANGNYNKQTYDTRVFQITTPIEIGYSFPLSAFRGSVSGGAAASWTFLDNNNLFSQQYLSNNPIFDIQVSRLFPTFRTVEGNAFGSLELSYGKWGIKAYYMLNSGLLQERIVSMKTSSFIVALSYQVY